MTFRGCFKEVAKRGENGTLDVGDLAMGSGPPRVSVPS